MTKWNDTYGQTHTLFSIGLATIFSFILESLPYALQYFQIQAAHFSSNAILNLSCRRIPFDSAIYLCSGTAHNRRWTPRQGQITSGRDSTSNPNPSSFDLWHSRQ